MISNVLIQISIIIYEMTILHNIDILYIMSDIIYIIYMLSDRLYKTSYINKIFYILYKISYMLY